MLQNLQHQNLQEVQKWPINFISAIFIEQQLKKNKKTSNNDFITALCPSQTCSKEQLCHDATFTLCTTETTVFMAKGTFACLLLLPIILTMYATLANCTIGQPPACAINGERE